MDANLLEERYSLILKLLAMDNDDASTNEGINATDSLKIEIYDSIITVVNKILVIVIILVFNIYAEKYITTNAF